jgi:hypothetical protein
MFPDYSFFQKLVISSILEKFYKFSPVLPWFIKATAKVINPEIAGMFYLSP